MAVRERCHLYLLPRGRFLDTYQIDRNGLKTRECRHIPRVRWLGFGWLRKDGVLCSGTFLGDEAGVEDGCGVGDLTPIKSNRVGFVLRIG